MNWAKTVLREVWALFVDDGALAIAILVWLGACALLAQFVAGAPACGVLFLGLVALLLHSATAQARRR